MKKIIGIITLMAFTLGQSNHATMTMYKDGFALIKQPVAWNMQPGESNISWDILPSGLIKDSPFLTLDNATVNMQRLNRDVFHFADRLYDFLGQTVDIKLINDKAMTGTLVEVTSNTITIQRRRSVISFNRNRIDYINAPGSLENVMYKPSLTWNISPKKKLGPVRGSLINLSKGFDWNAIYRLILDESGNGGEFLAEAYINNNSNLDFENVSLQLVEGNLKQNGHMNVPPLMMKTIDSSQENAEPQEDQLGDYHIYQLGGKIGLMGEESITTRLYASKRVSFEKTYLFENDERSQREEPLAIEYQIANIQNNNLGVPLPQGKIQLYQTGNQGNVEFVGEDEIRQVPKGATATIVSGRAFDVMGKRTVLNYDRQRKSEEGTISIEVKNTLASEIKIRMIEHIYGDWVVRDASANYRKKDASTIHFPLTIPANGSQTVTYTYRKEWN